VEHECFEGDGEVGATVAKDVVAGWRNAPARDVENLDDGNHGTVVCAGLALVGVEDINEGAHVVAVKEDGGEVDGDAFGGSVEHGRWLVGLSLGAVRCGTVWCGEVVVVVMERKEVVVLGGI